MSILVFDAQVLQTLAWHRGMGKYSLELIRSIAKRNMSSMKWEYINIIISSQIDIDDGLRNELQSLPFVKVCSLNLAPNDILNPSETARKNRTAINEFMADKEGDVAYVILSLMQGEISPTFPTVKTVHKAVLFYDLIPLMFHKTYLQNPITRKEYISKLEELFAADTYLAISKTVANDLSVYLGIEPSRIVSIDGGPIDHDNKVEAVDVPQPFILMPTGNDLRKNNRKGIEGFNLFNQKHGHKYTLIITSYFEDWQIKELSQLSDKVIFTGNISGARLNYLYKHAELLLFPSLYEGLGLPVLEALENNVRVACSNITVFREISHSAFSYFDPNSIPAIAEGIEDAMKHTLNLDAARKILQKYSWENTATIAEESIISSPSRDKQKLKLRILTPDISDSNRVGKFLLQSHNSFNKLFDMQYLESVDIAHTESRINFLPYVANIQPIGPNIPLAVEEANVIPVYHMVNRKESSFIALAALAIPGIIVLHDLELKDIWKDLKYKNLISSERYTLENEINKRYDATHSRWLGSLIAHQRAVVVFSRYAQENINQLLKNMGNTTTKVILFELPANNLVYTDIIATKKGKTLTLDDLRSLSDMEYEVAMSDAERLIIPRSSTSTDDLLAEVEAQKYIISTQRGYEAYAHDFADLIRNIEEVGE